MEYIPIRQQPNTVLLERHPVSVTVWVHIPRALVDNFFCHHIWRPTATGPGRWTWGVERTEYRMVSGAWDALVEFNDRTFGVVQRQHLGPALAALNHESLQAPFRLPSPTPPRITFNFPVAEAEETHNCTWCEEDHDPHCDDCECETCCPD